MFEANRGAAPQLDGAGLVIGIVQARFNAGITQALAQGCLQELAALGVAAADITHVQVPGALEAPLALHALRAKVGIHGQAHNGREAEHQNPRQRGHGRALLQHDPRGQRQRVGGPDAAQPR